MPRPRSSTGTGTRPSWASSTRRKRPPASQKTNPKPTLPKPNTNLVVELWDRPVYHPGRRPPPTVSLVPPRGRRDGRDAAYIVDKVITPFEGWGPTAATPDEYDTDEEDARYAADPARRSVQRVLNYVVAERANGGKQSTAWELVPCTRILDYVSPYTLESFEAAYCERQQAQRLKYEHHLQQPQQKQQKQQPQQKQQKHDEDRQRAAQPAQRGTKKRGRPRRVQASPDKKTPTHLSSLPPVANLQPIQIQLDASPVGISLTPKKNKTKAAGMALGTGLGMQPVASLSTGSAKAAKRSYDAFADDAEPDTGDLQDELQGDLQDELQDEQLVEENLAIPDEEIDDSVDELGLLPRVTPILAPAVPEQRMRQREHRTQALLRYPEPSPTRPAVVSLETSSLLSAPSHRETPIVPPTPSELRKRQKREHEAALEKTWTSQPKVLLDRPSRETPIRPPPIPLSQQTQLSQQSQKHAPADTELAHDGLFEIGRLGDELKPYVYANVDDAKTAPAPGKSLAPGPGGDMALKNLFLYGDSRFQRAWETAQPRPPIMVNDYLPQDHDEKPDQPQKPKDEPRLAALFDDDDEDDLAPLVLSDLA